MTREEAIKLFRKEIECLSHDKCSDCILEKVCDPSKTPFDSEYIDAFGVAIEALSAETCDSKNEEMNFPETWEEYERYYGFNDTEEVYSNNIRLIPSLRVKQWLDHLEQEPSIASASEWCRQHGYVMMPEAVYEQDITKAYFEGQNIEPCEDTISRQAVMDAMYDLCGEESLKDNPWRDNPHIDSITDAIEHLPSVTPKQKMGRWISFGLQGEIDGQIVRAFTCSECGAISIFRLSGGNIVNGDLCPNCGAKMAESEGEK